MMKPECPMCRCVIENHFVPKWVMERILYNAEQNSVNRVIQNEVLARQLILEEDGDVLDDDDRLVLDMDSSEEDDFHAHIENGRDMGLTVEVDPYGVERLALVVLR